MGWEDGVCVWGIGFKKAGPKQMTEGHHMAYLRVHSRASSLYLSRSVLYILAISGTRGSSGFGSQRREQIDSNTKHIRKKNDWNKLNLQQQYNFQLVDHIEQLYCVITF